MLSNLLRKFKELDDCMFFTVTDFSSIFSLSPKITRVFLGLAVKIGTLKKEYWIFNAVKGGYNEDRYQYLFQVPENLRNQACAVYFRR